MAPRGWRGEAAKTGDGADIGERREGQREAELGASCFFPFRPLSPPTKSFANSSKPRKLRATRRFSRLTTSYIRYGRCWAFRRTRWRSSSTDTWEVTWTSLVQYVPFLSLLYALYSSPSLAVHHRTLPDAPPQTLQPRFLHPARTPAPLLPLGHPLPLPPATARPVPRLLHLGRTDAGVEREIGV